MKKRNLIMLLLFIGCLWTGGCKDGKNPLDPEISEGEGDKNPPGSTITDCEDDILEAPVIAFKDLCIENAQQLVQGKWRVIKECGGIAGTCHDLTGTYVEYIGTTKCRFINPKSTTDYLISEWKKTKTGYEICLNPENFRISSFELRYLFNNDTLYYRQIGISDGYDWNAVRVK